jgi:hypothetical protein
MDRQRASIDPLPQRAGRMQGYLLLIFLAMVQNSTKLGFK